ncbi:hypothetical protein N7539_003024 [Penicillium diatomitis]|uniref:RING-type domain-containing protein n=1 Tax=Penicillium diatomitis TaxID=2819901 RepID=A0A9X0BZR2_9EURO|nr:uncharacterized protein N7539_003024 [Penicillium diatomitis]KAJ5491457.1 hypothetical protein N7539_003024 [Penicillium diatomitis]
MQKTDVAHGPLSAKDMKAIHMPCYLGCEYLNIDTCDLCLDDMAASSMFRQLPCGHIFHTPCVDLWLTTGDASCPLCRQTFYHLRNMKPSRMSVHHIERADQREHEHEHVSSENKFLRRIRRGLFAR